MKQYTYNLLNLYTLIRTFLRDFKTSISHTHALTNASKTVSAEPQSNGIFSQFQREDSTIIENRGVNRKQIAERGRIPSY